MLRKIISVAMVSLLVAVALCSCAKKPAELSSTAAKEQSQFSEVETSSVSGTLSEGTPSKKNETSSKKNETSSKKNETSSKKDETSSKKNETSSKNQTSSKPQTQTSSKTQSETVKIHPADTMGIGAFHFSPHWTTNYGEDEYGRMREFEDILSAGYFNTFICPLTYINNDEMWRICIENDVTVWLSCYTFFDSEKTTINEYIDGINSELYKLKRNPERWKMFQGFVHEENIWRKQSNNDFLTETGALYKKYGKRIFPVFATGEFTNYEGNQNQINMDGKDMRKINPAALKYVTDTAFDSYSVDVRDGAPNGGKYTDWQKVSPDIYDGESYYREYTRVMLELYDHPVNVWFYPCAYTTSLWGGINGQNRADEMYCLAHLNFFDELLDEQKYPGGMILYTYTQFSNPNELGLQSHLIVEYQDGSIKLRPDEEKWEYYSFRLKSLTEYYKKTKIKKAFK